MSEVLGDTTNAYDQLARRMEVASTPEERREVAEAMREHAMSLGPEPWNLDDEVEEGDA